MKSTQEIKSIHERVFTSVKSHRISADIVDQIQRAIFSGEFASGDKLPSEKDLVEQFGVSKVTVREALRILEIYGLVEIRQGAGGGAFVKFGDSAPVSVVAYNMLQLEGFDLCDLYTARIHFEPIVARIACENASASDLKALEEIVERTRRRVEEGEQTSPESVRFHSAIARATKNPVIEVTLGTLLDLTRLSGALIPSTREISFMVLDDHVEILKAMRDRDANRTRSLMEGHLRRLSDAFANLADRGEGLEAIDE